MSFVKHFNFNYCTLECKESSVSLWIFIVDFKSLLVFDAHANPFSIVECFRLLLSLTGLPMSVWHFLLSISLSLVVQGDIWWDASEMSGLLPVLCPSQVRCLVGLPSGGERRAEMSPSERLPDLPQDVHSQGVQGKYFFALQVLQALWFREKDNWRN